MIRALIAVPVILSAPVMAEQCVLQERTVTQHLVTIEERTPVRRDVVPMPNGQRKCIVDFRVRIGNSWHSAMGEHAWDGQAPSSEACATAVARAESQVRERVGRSQSSAERILVCKDRPELKELASSVVGTVGDAGQFRVHPQYHQRFWYNGAQCRWFVEPAFTGTAIHTYQGIVCDLGQNRWVVVDKF